MKRFVLPMVLVLSLAGFASAAGPYRNHFHAALNGAYGYGGYSGAYGYGNGGYLGYGYYQPWSTSIYASPYGGAMYQFNGGVIGPGFYMPYSFSGYMPTYGYGYGWGGGY